jgi:hypothetical protein
MPILVKRDGLLFSLSVLVFTSLFVGCTSKPEVVSKGVINNYELGGREPCVDIIHLRNSSAKALVKKANEVLSYPSSGYNEKLDFLDSTTRLVKLVTLSDLTGLSELDVCSTNGKSNLTDDLNSECSTFRDHQSMARKCLSNSTGDILVNPFVQLR